MTFWKGMFRAWVLASILYACFLLLIGWGSLANPSIPRETWYMKDAAATPYKLANPYPSYDFTRELREISLPNSVVLYAAKDIPEARVATARATITREASEPRNGEAWIARLWSGWELLLVFLAGSGIVLILGMGARWVASGSHPKAGA